jgi:NitT/TauT family transport system ATP-binding protein
VVMSRRPGTIRRIISIDLGEGVEGPLAARRSPRMSEYFNLIWKELEE